MKAELVLGNLKREREALNGKMERLENALAKEWQDEDQEYLCTQQYNAMSLYAHILDERIADIECKLECKKLEKEAKSHETRHDSKSIYNKEIDFKSYEKNMDNMHVESKDEIKTDDTVYSILRMVEDIFGIEII